MLGELALSLVCSVTYPGAETSSAQASDIFNPAESVSIETTTAIPQSGRLFVELNADGRGRIRLPQGYVGGRGDGWRDLRDANLSDDKVEARFTYQLTVNGSLIIDRMTGEVRVIIGNPLWGRELIHGDCAKYDPPTERRF